MRRWEALVRQSPSGGYISTCVLFWPEACISPLFLGVAIVAMPRYSRQKAETIERKRGVRWERSDYKVGHSEFERCGSADGLC